MLRGFGTDRGGSPQSQNIVYHMYIYGSLVRRCPIHGKRDRPQNRSTINARRNSLRRVIKTLEQFQFLGKFEESSEHFNAM